jgi:hypothetical protein
MVAADTHAPRLVVRAAALGALEGHGRAGERRGAVLPALRATMDVTEVTTMAMNEDVRSGMRERALAGLVRGVEGFLDLWEQAFPGDDGLRHALAEMLARRREISHGERFREDMLDGLTCR